MIKVAIIGSTGYAGSELVRILSLHKEAELVYLASHSYQGKKFSEVYPFFAGVCDLVLQEDDLAKAAEAADVVFLALPHGLAGKMVNDEILSKAVIIDLGADFRLSDPSIYEEWYKTEAPAKEMLSKAVYGLPELHRDEIKKSRLIANPGCYTTASILALAPLLKNHLVKEDSIIVDAKSGVSGAGRSAKTDNLYAEVNESIKPYGVKTHRHTPEIEQEVSLLAGEKITLQFTPHLVPMNRGILSCCYAKLKEGKTAEDVSAAFSMYEKEKFIRLTEHLPQTRYVRGSNYVDIHAEVDERTGNVLVFSALDNLVKGAAGQAVQNMNLIFGLSEAEGLEGGSGV